MAQIALFGLSARVQNPQKPAAPTPILILHLNSRTANHFLTSLTFADSSTTSTLRALDLAKDWGTIPDAIKCIRLYAADDGESHFEDIKLKCPRYNMPRLRFAFTSSENEVVPGQSHRIGRPGRCCSYINGAGDQVLCVYGRKDWLGNKKCKSRCIFQQGRELLTLRRVQSERHLNARVDVQHIIFGYMCRGLAIKACWIGQLGMWDIGPIVDLAKE